LRNLKAINLDIDWRYLIKLLFRLRSVCRSKTEKVGLRSKIFDRDRTFSDCDSRIAVDWYGLNSNFRFLRLFNIYLIFKHLIWTSFSPLKKMFEILQSFKRRTLNKKKDNPDRNLDCRSKSKKVGLRSNFLIAIQTFWISIRNGLRSGVGSS
jgi:hypothetical protein